MIYQKWGFNSSPFQTTSLPPTELGKALLVGRDKELESLVRKIASPPKLATLEGLNGVGKTSVVNVACYKLFNEYTKTGEGALYVPCRRVFQLNPNQDLQVFIDTVLMEVAQTLIDRANEVKNHHPSLRTAGIDRWLNSPQLLSFQAGGWAGLLHSDGIVGIADMDCPVFRQISIVSRSSEYSIHAKCVFIDWAGDLFAVHLTKK